MSAAEVRIPLPQGAVKSNPLMIVRWLADLYLQRGERFSQIENAGAKIQRITPPQMD
jgi:hypothetical protein